MQPGDSFRPLVDPLSEAGPVSDNHSVASGIWTITDSRGELKPFESKNPARTVFLRKNPEIEDPTPEFCVFW
jgi:hypothetical protein